MSKVYAGCFKIKASDIVNVSFLHTASSVGYVDLQA